MSTRCFHHLKVGDRINLEFDIIGKYVARMLSGYQKVKTVRHIGVLDDEIIAVRGMVFQLEKLLPQAEVKGFTQYREFELWCENKRPNWFFWIWRCRMPWDSMLRKEYSRTWEI